MVPDNWGDKVMHSGLKIGDTPVMASDGCAVTSTEFKGFSLTPKSRTRQTPIGCTPRCPTAAR